LIYFVDDHRSALEYAALHGFKNGKEGKKVFEIQMRRLRDKLKMKQLNDKV